MTRNQMKLAGLCSVILLLSSTQVPIVAAEGQSTSISDTNTLRMTYYGSENPSFEPGQIGQLQFNTQEGLVRYDSKQDAGGVVPGLASSWTQLNATTYSFTLRNAKWSDGTAVTAADFEYGWKRWKQTASADELKVFPISSVVANGDTNVVVTFLRSGADLLKILANEQFVPIKQSFVEQMGNSFGQTPQATLFSGPYVVDQTIPQSHVTLLKNPNYWDSEHVQLEKVVLYLNMDPTTSSRLFQEGKLDQVGVGYQFSPFYTDEQKSPFLSADSSFLVLKTNDLSSPLHNPHIRNALRLSIQPEGFGPAGLTGFVPPTIAGATDLYRKESPIGSSYNPEKARSELQLGIRDLQGSSSTYSLPTLELAGQYAEKNLAYLPEIWKEVLGIDVKLTSVTYPHQFGSHAIEAVDWRVDYNDPEDYLELYRSGGLLQDLWSDPTYDQLISDADQQTNPTLRMQKLATAEKMLLDQSVVIPLYTKSYEYLVNPNVSLANNEWNKIVDFKYTTKKPRTLQTLTTFRDADTLQSYMRRPVEHLINTGVVNGTGENKFEPYSYVTREQFVKMVVKAMGIPYAQSNQTFTDMKEGMWSYPYVDTAAAKGIVNGIPLDGSLKFNPNGLISRAEMAAILKRVLNLPVRTSSGAFTDIEGHWAAQDIQAAYAAGLIKGYNGKFAPDDHTTRGDAAVVIDRALSIQALPAMNE